MVGFEFVVGMIVECGCVLVFVCFFFCLYLVFLFRFLIFFLMFGFVFVLCWRGLMICG